MRSAVRAPRLVLAVAFAVGCGGQPEKVEIPDPLPSRITAPEPAAPACELGEFAFRPAENEGRTAHPLELGPELKRVRERLVRIVDDYGRDPDNPWAIGHAMLVYGAELELTNGRPAVDWLFTEYAEPGSHGIGFPEKRGRIRVEPHSDLLLKSLAEAGLGPDHAVTVQGKAYTLADLYRQSLCEAWVDGGAVSYGAWNDTPWALQALAAWAPEDLVWTTTGRTMTLDIFAGAVVDKLHAETAFMRSAMEAGSTVQKRKQGIFGYTCGGAHLIQGAHYAVARGFGNEAHRERAAAEIPVLFWRIDVELNAVDEAARQHPTYAPILLEQRLKFLGHFLETVYRASALGLFEPDEDQQQALERVANELVHTVDALEKTGLLDKLDELRKSNEQLFLDVVGDAAHAVRGIDLATGRATVAW